MKLRVRMLCWLGIALLAPLLGGCGEWAEAAARRAETDATVGSDSSSTDSTSDNTSDNTSSTSPFAARSEHATSRAMRQAFFGDLHVHTQNSFDAFNFGVRATPDDAYRYAKGEAIEHPLGFPIRMRGGPLDFLAVSDHAEYLGTSRALADPKGALGQHPLAKKVQSGDLVQAMEAFNALGSVIDSGTPVPGLDADEVIRSTWQENIAAAERHNDPGRFTAFIAYEYSSTPGNANLHRNVVFAGSKAPDVPFGAAQSLNPEDLWTWLDEQRAKGIEALAIPHNSNWSQGKMFARTNWAGQPIDAAYAAKRRRNEPLVEVTQVKGTSETHPALSPDDEWADFELWKTSQIVPGEGETFTLEAGATTGAYARDALRTGLEMKEAIGENPYSFGFIGSSDGHDAAGPVEEDQYFGKLGLADGSAELRGSVPKTSEQVDYFPWANLVEWGASGLAGAWAEENTRASLYAAFRRKETFGTSGPRIQVRLFAGYDYPEGLPARGDAIERAYAAGVPMGGELAARGESVPRFFLWSVRDPRDTWLERAQIVKGWIEAGESHERVFDVACSSGRKPDPKTHRCPADTASVNLEDCSYSVGTGAAELAALWRDPTFDPDQRAFYYARVLQNPTCRWTTWDALRAGVEPNPDVPATIQERAWSSPIFYAPAPGKN